MYPAYRIYYLKNSVIIKSAFATYRSELFIVEKDVKTQETYLEQKGD
jgi:hypothetical protein